MALELTDSAKRAVAQTQVSPNIVFQIDGYDEVFGAVEIKEVIKYGSEAAEYGSFDWGQLTAIEGQETWINLGGTSTSIKQQLRPDQGNISSVSSLKVQLIDKDGRISQLISPGFDLEDILGRKAIVYLGFADTSWPEDYSIIFRGFIDDVESGAGNVSFNISHPDNKKRQQIFQRIDSTLDASTILTVADDNASLREKFFQLRAPQSNNQYYAWYFVDGSGTDPAPSGLIGIQVSIALDASASAVASATAAAINALGDFNVTSTVGNAIRVKDAVDGGAILTDDSGSTGFDFVGVTSTDTDIVLEDASNMLTRVTGPDGTEDDSFTPYVRIDDEFIEYTGISGNQLTGVTRGAQSTTAVTHDKDSESSTVYQLEDDVLPLALKIMMSGTQGPWRSDVSVTNYGSIGDASINSQAIFFEGIDVETLYGVSIGDFVTTTGSINPANDITLEAITAIVQDDVGSYIEIAGQTFVTETESTAKISFRSQFDTLPDGLQMGGDEVDVKQHTDLEDLFLFGFAYRFFVRDTINGKEFIEDDLYQPYALYSVPRKGKASVQFHIGPIPLIEIKTFNKDNIRNPDKIVVRRTTSRNFYNTIVHKFDERLLDDGEYANGRISTDADSKARIPVGNKTFEIESKGMRSDLNAANRADLAAERLLSRYKFAAEFFERIEVFFKDAFSVEPGDIVLMDFEGLNVTSSATGDRNRPSKFYEIINKSLNIKNGQVQLTIVDTSFDAEERYGLIAPSSRIDTGSTTSEIIIKDSFGEIFPDNEQNKWTDYIGLPIVVHNEDYTFSEEVTLQGFDGANKKKMLVNPPLSISPPADYIVDFPLYPNTTDINENRNHKLFHAFFAPRVTVVSGTDNFSFDVAGGDVSKFFVDGTVLVHNSDFSTESPEVKVSSIVGTTITVDTDLGFTPSAGFEVDFIGFPDLEPSYRLI